MKFREIENNLNNMPRKSLDYLTPIEAVSNYVAHGNIRVESAVC
jgi:IS30 family transposase